MDVARLWRCVCACAIIVSSYGDPHVIHNVRGSSNPRVCSGPPETGPCRASIPKWFYNETASECQRFIYGGCGGSDNRHDSKEACRTACEQSRPSVTSHGGGNMKKKGYRFKKLMQVAETSSMAISAFGRTAVVVGSNVTFTCQSKKTNNASWVFYPRCSLEVVQLLDHNSNNGQRSSVHSSRINAVASGGKSNLLIVDVQASDAGRYECLEQHSTRNYRIFQLDVYPAASSTACSAPPSMVRCRKATPMWYYDPARGVCRRFMYGGCSIGDNDNRFDSRPLCESTCVGRPRQLKPTSAADGSSGGGRQRFHSDRLPQFAKAAMTTTIAALPTRKQSTAVAHADEACRGPPETGRCRASIPKWYYDEKLSACQTFVYGGCGGNENRHDSREECERRCQR